MGPARLPLVGAACCKLLLIAILVAVHSRSLRASGVSEHSGVAPLPLRAHRRTLAAQVRRNVVYSLHTAATNRRAPIQLLMVHAPPAPPPLLPPRPPHAAPRRMLVSRLPLQQPSQDPEIATRAQAQLLPPRGPGDGGGSVLLPGLIPSGTALGQPGTQPSVAACCAACRADPECTAFWYCNREVRGSHAGWRMLWQCGVL